MSLCSAPTTQNAFFLKSQAKCQTLFFKGRFIMIQFNIFICCQEEVFLKLHYLSAPSYFLMRLMSMRGMKGRVLGAGQLQNGK
jgi:hypothetical protein